MQVILTRRSLDNRQRIIEDNIQQGFPGPTRRTRLSSKGFQNYMIAVKKMRNLDYAILEKSKKRWSDAVTAYKIPGATTGAIIAWDYLAGGGKVCLAYRESKVRIPNSILI